MLSQAHTHNRVNEITGISNASGRPIWIEPAYGHNGNTTLLPQPDAPTTGFTLVYDAWNFPVEVKTSGSSPKTVAKYSYNGLRRRIRKEVHDASGALATTVLYFNNLGWQCLESRETPVVGSAATTTYVWGRRYIDDLVCRDRGGTRLYAMQDRQYKTLAIADASGAVQERYGYTPYGVASIYAANYIPRSASSYAWTCLYTGREFDPETGLYYFRNRYYDASLGRFVSRDPIGYEGSPWNLYQYVGSRALSHEDPSGLYGTMPGYGPGWDRSACCDGKRFDTNRQGCCSKTIYNTANECCESGSVVRKEPIWIGVRPLGNSSNFPFVLPAGIRTVGHSYVCCDGPNINCFGKQARITINGTEVDPEVGDPIPVEPFATATSSTRVMVCPSVKKSKCVNPVYDCPYSLLNDNCHRWAWDDTEKHWIQ